MRRENKTGGGKRHHQDRDHRQKREIGDSGAKLVAQPIVKTLCGADQVGNHRLTLDSRCRRGDRFERLGGLVVCFWFVTIVRLHFGHRRMVEFLNRAFYVFFLRHQVDSPSFVNSQNSIACQST
ncbi:Uncharacterised protein [Citrobacter koseri]|uniref:Uncharacterized protein n=1 Tax=Citrobacter koseri TaxID=545 RepID=A0A3S4M7S3_CITKO|nr:Uncharacterised protein [Citrobacter koseri]